MWPMLRSSLQSEASAKPALVEESRFSINSKFRSSLLKFLSSVDKHLKLNDTLVSEQVDLCKHFLSQRHPKEIQEEALALFKQLISSHVRSFSFLLIIIYIFGCG